MRRIIVEESGEKLFLDEKAFGQMVLSAYAGIEPGTYVKMIDPASGCIGVANEIGFVTFEKFKHGLPEGNGRFNIKLSNGEVWCVDGKYEVLNSGQVLEYLSAIALEKGYCKDSNVFNISTGKEATIKDAYFSFHAPNNKLYVNALDNGKECEICIYHSGLWAKFSEPMYCVTDILGHRVFTGSLDEVKKVVDLLKDTSKVFNEDNDDVKKYGHLIKSTDIQRPVRIVPFDIDLYPVEVPDIITLICMVNYFLRHHTDQYIIFYRSENLENVTQVQLLPDGQYSIPKEISQVNVLWMGKAAEMRISDMVHILLK